MPTSAPSGRPPDPLQQAGFQVGTDTTPQTTLTMMDSAMVIDGGVKDGRPTADSQTLARDTTSTQPGSGPFSYANAVTGLLKQTTNPLTSSQWMPVGEHDLVPRDFNGEPALRVSTSFMSKL
ncbi:unnamed protein product [Linum trigynum]|uniref:Uncharacterized protein n=1 Tax=Linum trigynum TaxID=586398 RepID=A0AAV2E1M6_9ROSI